MRLAFINMDYTFLVIEQFIIIILFILGLHRLPHSLLVFRHVILFFFTYNSQILTTGTYFTQGYYSKSIKKYNIYNILMIYA